MELRIVLLPDRNGEELYKNYSNLLSQNFPSLIKLGDRANPHITLIHAKEILHENLGKMINKISYIANQNTVLDLKFKKPSQGSVEGFIGIWFEDNSKVIELRDLIKGSLNDYLVKTSKFEEPHVTLARFRSTGDVEKSLDLIKDFPKKPLIFNQIAICETGENGTCTKIISSFSLKSVV